MRLAVVVTPLEDSLSGAPPVALAERLALGGWRVLRAAPSMRLVEELDSALSDVVGGDSVLLYVAGFVYLEGDGSVALERSPGGGDGPSFEALAAELRRRHVQDGLFVVDALYQGEDDGFVAAEYVDALARAVGAREGGYGLLAAACAARRAERSDVRWAMTSLVLGCLDDPAARDDRGRVTVTRVYERVRMSPDLVLRVPSFANVRGITDFVLLDPTPSAIPLPIPSGPVSVPPSSRASLELLVGAAEDAYARGAWDEALLGYKRALMVAPPSGSGADAGQARASIYARIGEAKLMQGKRREAELNFDKALAASSTHRRSYEVLIELAAADRDWARVLSLRKRLRAALDDPAELLPIAEVLEDRMRDVRGARLALEEARTALPRNVGVLTRLRAIYEKLSRWAKLAEVLEDLRALSSNPGERAELAFAQADVTLGRLREEAGEGRGIELLEAALEDDPAHERALSALVAVRTRRQEWGALDRVYKKLVDRYAERGDLDRAWETCRKLGLLRRDRSGDLDGALDAFEGALRCKPDDVETRAAVVDVLMTKGDLDRALRELERMSREAPTRVATFRKLFELHNRRGDVDRAWLAATALEELRAADMDHQLLIGQFRLEPGTGVRADAVLDDEAWSRLLRAPGSDDAVAAILSIVGRAAAASQVHSLRAKKKLFSLNPERKQSTESTASIVRTFVWASHVLGAPLPDLYVYDDVPGGLAAVQGEAMATAMGPAVRSGLPVRELAFLVGRHLTYYRPEHYALIFFPTLAEMTKLFLAAVSLALPSLFSAAGRSVAALRAKLGNELQEGERDALVAAAERFEERGGKLDLASWIRGVELTATRAGMLLSGDLAVVMHVLRREQRSIADVSLDDKRADLLAFSASSALAELRRMLRVEAHPPSSRLPVSQPARAIEDRQE